MQEKESTGTNDEHATYVSGIITDEVLRYRVRNLIAEETEEPESRISRITHNPIVIMIVAFFLIWLVCIRFIDVYSSQRLRTSISRQSLDEINRIRVNSIGEVWQKVNLYDAALGVLLQSVSAGPNGAMIIEGPAEELKGKYDRVERLYVEMSTAMDGNRYWLGEQIYDGLRKYADDTYKAFLGFKSEQKFKQMGEKRRQARAELNQLRDKLFSGEIR